MTNLGRRVPRFLDALPSYLGGKRRLLGRIARALPPPGQAPVLVDAFAGGAAVSLWSKWRGHQVVANDVAERAAIIGRALVENDKVRLACEDLTRVFAERPEGRPGFIEETFGGHVVPGRHATFLDALMAEADRRAGPKRALLQLLAMRYVLSLRPLGNFGARSVIEQLERANWEDVNPSVLRDSFTRRIQAHPRRLAEDLRQKINRGVFSNGLPSEVRQGDVFTFLEGVEGDVVYLDPPYGGTQAYETALRPLDSILAGRVVDTKPSVFSGRHGSEALDELIAACSRMPRLVLSYGNAAMTPEDVETIVKRHRSDVRMEVIAYAHLAAVASAETKARNVEILIAAGRAK